jgi:hypothetical protein
VRPANEGQVIIERIDAAATTTGRKPVTEAADAGYDYGKVYGDLEERGIDPVIPAKAEPIRSAVPLCRCAGSAMMPSTTSALSARQNLMAWTSDRTRMLPTFKARDCSRCLLASVCLSKGRSNKAMVVSGDYTRRCSALADAVFAGQSRSDVSIGGTAGFPRAFTVRPKLGMASLELCAAASRISASNRS